MSEAGGERARPYTRLTRPYALTGGRTEPADNSLAIEAMVEMSWRGYDAREGVEFEKGEILDLTRRAVSVAEIAAHLAVPLGVARVLVGDLAEAGHVIIHAPAEDEDGGRDPHLLEKVLHGLRSL